MRWIAQPWFARDERIHQQQRTQTASQKKMTRLAPRKTSSATGMKMLSKCGVGGVLSELTAAAAPVALDLVADCDLNAPAAVAAVGSAIDTADVERDTQIAYA